LIISRSFLLKMRNISEKRCKENHNTRFMFNNVLSKIVRFYEIMQRSMVEPDSPQITVQWHISLARWITEATDTHSEYVTLVVFPLQQWLRERASILRLYAHCLPCFMAEHGIFLWYPRVQQLSRIHRRTSSLLSPGILVRVSTSSSTYITSQESLDLTTSSFSADVVPSENTRVGILIVATIYLQLIQNRYMFRSFTVIQCSHQHCVQPVASDVEVVGYLQQRLLCW